MTLLNVKNLFVYTLSALIVYLFSCSTEPSKEGAEDSGLKIDIGENDAGINTSRVSGGLSSKDAFSLTVFPLAVKNCGACHGADTAPLFANDDIDKALSALEESKKVLKSDVANSRLVKRLSEDKHNCWSDCQENGKQMEDAIKEWIRLAGKKTSKENADGISFASANADNACNKVGETIFIEAESGTATNGYAPQTEDDITYIASASADNTNVNATDQPTMTYSVDIKKTGYYAFHGRVSVLTGTGQDSFFIKVNDSPLIASGMDQNDGRWDWDAFAQQTPTQISTFFMEKGENTFQIRHRERNIKLDSIVLTTDLSFSGYSEDSKIMCFDISSEVGEESGVYFGFAIEKFGSESSYKVSKPVVISAKDNLYLEDIDILINGKTVPQYNAFKAVKETFGPGKSPVSSTTMIMDIDKSYDEDKFTVSFGKIEYR